MKPLKTQLHGQFLTLLVHRLHVQLGNQLPFKRWEQLWDLRQALSAQISPLQRLGPVVE